MRRRRQALAHPACELVEGVYQALPSRGVGIAGQLVDPRLSALEHLPDPWLDVSRLDQVERERILVGEKWLAESFTR